MSGLEIRSGRCGEGKNLLNYREWNPGCQARRLELYSNATGLIAITKNQRTTYVQGLMDMTLSKFEECNLICTLSTFHIFMVGLMVVLWFRSIAPEVRTRRELSCPFIPLTSLQKTALEEATPAED
jgi:hypothetical protein